MGCCRGTRHTPYCAFTILLSLLTIGAARAGDQPTLRFSVGDQRIATLDLDQLRSQLPTHDIALRDPDYQAQKHFRAFALADVLDLGFGERWRGDDYPEAVFIASDGYQGLGSSNKLGEPGGYVAFADLDVDVGWEPMGKGQINPGPFYIVWSGAEQGAAQAYPWPWQLAEISILRFQDQYPAVYPTGAAEHSSAMRGYALFKDRCFRCHAMDEQGGKIGPDLNAPMSVVEYRSAIMIREFIRHPSRYRHTHMPDHEDLSDRALDDLLDYFHHQARAGRHREP